MDGLVPSSWILLSSCCVVSVARQGMEAAAQFVQVCGEMPERGEAFKNLLLLTAQRMKQEDSEQLAFLTTSSTPVGGSNLQLLQSLRNSGEFGPFAGSRLEELLRKINRYDLADGVSKYVEVYPDSKREGRMVHNRVRCGCVCVCVRAIQREKCLFFTVDLWSTVIRGWFGIACCGVARTFTRVLTAARGHSCTWFCIENAIMWFFAEEK